MVLYLATDTTPGRSKQKKDWLGDVSFLTKSLRDTPINLKAEEPGATHEVVLQDWPLEQTPSLAAGSEVVVACMAKINEVKHWMLPREPYVVNPLPFPSQTCVLWASWFFKSKVSFLALV